MTEQSTPVAGKFEAVWLEDPQPQTKKIKCEPYTDDDSEGNASGDVVEPDVKCFLTSSSDKDYDGNSETEGEQSFSKSQIKDEISIEEHDIMNETPTEEINWDIPFSSLSYEEKCAMKDKRPTPHLNIVQSDGHQSRKFHSHWYDQYEWLTANAATSKLYCYICLLLGGSNKDWCESGIGSIRNFHRRARKHQISKGHILNWERYHFLGKSRVENAPSEAIWLSTLKHNEMVSRNRRFVGRLIQVICFLGKQELPLGGHDERDQSKNKGNYLEMLDILAQEEQFVRENLESASSFKGTSSDIQNELIECVTLVVNETIQKELDSCEFISVQVDETLDVSCQPQISIIFRYCVNDYVQERFIGFFDISRDKTALGLATVILNVLKDRKVDNKLVCQTYDGTSLMAGSHGGVHTIVKQQCLYALFIHCYAHKLNLVLLHATKTIKQVHHFLYDLTAFQTYFNKSSERSQLLREAGFKLPQESTTHWNNPTRAIAIITSHFHEIKGALSHIVDNDTKWDGESFNGALGLLKRLQDSTFLFLLCFFQKIFIFTGQLFNVLQAKFTSNVNVCNHEVKLAITFVKCLRNEETVAECISTTKSMNDQAVSESFKTIKMLAFEIIDTVVTHMEYRFEDLDNFHFAELLDEKQFRAYKSSFPSSKLSILAKEYPHFNSEQLKNELTNVYSDDTKHLPPNLLLKCFLDNGLEKIYKETVRLIRLLLTVPIPVTWTERNTNALRRVKTFLRNSMTDSRLSNLSMLAIESALLNDLSRDDDFKERVIDVFAERKTPRNELIYKK